MAAPDGLLIVDKPSGWTSHDVVGRCRRLAETRKVGHAGTLDPMATGVLVLGVGRATRLLGHLSQATKGYDATIRLGQSTVTDDAEGELVASVDARHLRDADVEAAVARFRGHLQQVPSTVSAIKVNGQRAYARVRAGEEVTLASRPVHVASLDMRAVRRGAGFVDVDLSVECSTGTYVRALARDIGASLAVGGHVTSLRRTRVGCYRENDAHTLDRLARCQPGDLPIMGLDESARRAFAWRVIDEAQVEAVRNGRPLELLLRAPESPSDASKRGIGGDGPIAVLDPVAVLAPSGRFLALYEQHGPVAKAVAVFAPA